jgi:hypothetical protein
MLANMRRNRCIQSQIVSVKTFKERYKTAGEKNITLE